MNTVEVVAKALVGEIIVHEQMFPRDSFTDEQIDSVMYNAIRNAIDIYHTADDTVDIYVFGHTYMEGSERYARLSDESIRIAIASTLVNFVTIEVL